MTQQDQRIVRLASACISALNLGQLVHFARVNTPMVGATEGDYELDKIRMALDELAIESPDLYNAAFE